jgi:hypothetical protein
MSKLRIALAIALLSLAGLSTFAATAISSNPAYAGNDDGRQKGP